MTEGKAAERLCITKDLAYFLKIKLEDNQTFRTHHVFGNGTGYATCDNCDYQFGNDYLKTTQQDICPGCGHTIAYELTENA